MPADRYWDFEDGHINFGTLAAAKNELVRVAVIEYALVFGNDWFTLPVALPVNALYQVEKLDVPRQLRNHREGSAAKNPDGTQWTMYEMSVNASPLVLRPRLTDRMFLCPAVSALQGAPLEHVLVMRDEMANVVWGIEKRVQGTAGEPFDRKFESNRLSTTHELRPPADAVVVSGGAPLNYKLQTPEQGSPDNRLQGFMFHPRGSLLRLDPNAPVETDYLRLEEEEVPRDGIEVTRVQLRARCPGPGAALDRAPQEDRPGRGRERAAVRRHSSWQGRTDSAGVAGVPGVPGVPMGAESASEAMRTSGTSRHLAHLRHPSQVRHLRLASKQADARAGRSVSGAPRAGSAPWAPSTETC